MVVEDAASVSTAVNSDMEIFGKLAPVKVPRLHYQTTECEKLIRLQEPVILTGLDLVESANKWTLEYLNQHLGQGPFTVFSHVKNSTISYNEFKYFDENKLKDFSGKFSTTVKREILNWDEFLSKFNGTRNIEKVYLQQPLNSGVGEEIVKDFSQFNWKWSQEQQQKFNWGALTSNLLLIGQGGNITPCHYDEMENFFCQLSGVKKFLLFSPDKFPCLYPYPVYHPHDRQSQVDFRNPNLEIFSKFQNLAGFDATLYPGDTLYLPMYWWHHVINLSDTIGINFWYKAAGAVQNLPLEYPLKSWQKVAILRNIEHNLLTTVKSEEELRTLIQWLAQGRYF